MRAFSHSLPILYQSWLTMSSFFCAFCKIIGCPGRARTSDKLINSQLLSQLSYWAKCSYRKNPTLSLEDLESLLLSVGAHSPNIVWKKLRFLTMPSLTNTVAGTLTLPHTQNKETICIVLSFDCSTLWLTSFSFSSSVTLSEWLVPTLWSLKLISSPSHRPSTFELCLFESYPLVE